MAYVHDSIVEHTRIMMHSKSSSAIQYDCTILKVFRMFFSRHQHSKPQTLGYPFMQGKPHLYHPAVRTLSGIGATDGPWVESKKVTKIIPSKEHG